MLSGTLTLESARRALGIGRPRLLVRVTVLPRGPGRRGGAEQRREGPHADLQSADPGENRPLPARVAFPGSGAGLPAPGGPQEGVVAPMPYLERGAAARGAGQGPGWLPVPGSRPALPAPAAERCLPTPGIHKLGCPQGLRLGHYLRSPRRPRAATLPRVKNLSWDLSRKEDFLAPALASLRIPAALARAPAAALPRGHLRESQDQHLRPRAVALSPGAPHLPRGRPQPREEPCVRLEAPPSAHSPCWPFGLGCVYVRVTSSRRLRRTRASSRLTFKFTKRARP